MGNITEIRENGLLAVRYFYDSLSRLIREDNKKLNKTCLISYDNCGNILSKRTCAFTLAATDEISSFTEEKEYAYDGDKLVSFGGQSVSYNEYGQPTVYKGINLAFAKDRLTYFGNTQIFYDGSGRRIARGNSAFMYDNEGNLIRLTNGLDVIDFIYDESGICGITRGSSQYYFRKNVQGDVTHIYSVDGTLEAKYVYDAWGNHKVYDANGNELLPASTNIGNINPIRYRGYYYDSEFGLYYLQTRYYDPEVGRFISQDDSSYLAPEQINGLNLYAYCNNNPVMNVDPEGTAWWHWVLGALAVVAVTALTVVTCGAAAVALGASAAVVAGVMAGAAVGGLVVGGANLISQGLTGDGSVDFVSLVSSTFIGGVVGGVIGGFAGYFAPTISSFINSSFTFSIPWVTMSSGSLAFSSVAVTVTGAQLVEGAALAGSSILYSIYNRKPAGPRDYSNTKKDAYQKAFYKGGKREPILHNNGKFGPHYHPALEKYKHWHFYFTVLLLLRMTSKHA